MQTTTVSRSAIFANYNVLKSAGVVDEGRLNRALGVAQKTEPRPYTTTRSFCTCPDFSGVDKNGRRFKAQSVTPCKHQVAMFLRGE